MSNGNTYGYEGRWLLEEDESHSLLVQLIQKETVSLPLTMSNALRLLLPLFGSIAAAQDLYATHYSGTVNHLVYSGTSLTLKSSTKSGNVLPSWITYDSTSKQLFVPDENWNAKTGNTVSFSIGADGVATQNGKATTPSGVVATTLYGGADGKSYLANAH